MTADGRMTAAEAAERLGVTTRTIGRWARDGRLPPARKFLGLRGPYLFERAEVERVAAELLQQAEARAEALRREAAS
jgi:excisionase family DNA binding protein